MKKPIIPPFRCLISFLFAGLLFAACKKESNTSQPEGPSYMGSASMVINGEEVTFSTLLVYSYNSVAEASLLITDVSPEGREGKSISVSTIPLNLEKHRLAMSTTQDVRNAEASLSQSDGDVLMYHYSLNEEDEIEDFIQFTHINEETREVKGIFQASFLENTLVAFNSLSPDTIVITAGTFETVLQDR